MNASPVLLADADLFKLILFVVVGAFAVIKHLLDANAKGKQPRPGAKPDARPRPRPAPAGRPEMPTDVNDFLRRAAEKRAAAQRPPKNEPEPPPRRLVTTKLDAPLGQEVVDAQAVDDVHAANSVGAYVEDHLGTREEAAAHLTQVSRSEAMFQAHLQQTFQHHVGQLDAQANDPAAPAAAPPAAEAPWTALLADPGNIRQAVVLNEILQRPVDRWQ